MTEKEKVNFILEQLNILYPDAKAELDFENDFELLVAVVLSAQTTDIQVNIVTKDLFLYYPTPEKMMNADILHVESILNRIGLYRTKAKNVVNLSKMIVENFDGKVPSNRKDLESLPGVGRKTANVVLSVAFNIPAIAVDTHVARVSKRLGLVLETDSVEVIEKKLMKMFPEETWTKLHHQLILFGRYICTARNPKTELCPFKLFCGCSNLF